MGEGGAIFRADGSKELGMGHVVRSLSLASKLTAELEERGREIRIQFVVREDAGSQRVLQGSLFINRVRWIPPDARDIDSMAEIVGELGPAVVVTDIDLRGRVEEYQAAIFPSAHVSLHEHNYGILAADRVIAPTVRPLTICPDGAPGVTHFAGSEYILLSDEISKLRHIAQSPEDPPRKVLVTMGGGDPAGLTRKVLGAIRGYNDPKVEWTVVLGPASGYDKSEFVREFPMKIEYLEGAELPHDDFLQSLVEADAVITNGATTLYEALALGRPSMAVPQNEFESDVVRILAEKGACVTPSDATSVGIMETMNRFLSDRSLRENIGSVGMELIDGQGARRVATMILELLG